MAYTGSRDDGYGRSRDPLQLGPGDYEETVTRKVSQPPPLVPPKTRLGMTVPEGVNLLGDSSNRRIGNTERDKYLAHLHWLNSEGYIDDGEYEARKAFVETAKISQELRMIIDDLPGFPAPTPKEQHQEEQAGKYRTLRQRLGENRAENAALILALCVIGISTAVAPWILVQKGQPITFAIAACGTITGVALVIGALIWASKAFDWS